MLAICLFVWAISMAGCSDSSSSAPEKFQTEAFVLDEFQNLLDYIDSPTTELSDEQRKDFLSKVSDARDAYENGDPCEAADILSDYLDLAQGLRQDELVAIAEGLFNRGWLLNYNMLTSLLETCEGYEGFGRPPKVQISESNNEHIKGSFTFGVPSMWPAEDGGEVFTQVQLPGMPGPIGGPGLPAVPLYHRLIAMPRGAGVEITGTAHEGKTIYMNLYPVQIQPMDTDEEDPPFVKDDAVYATDAPFPGKVLSVKSVGYIRDVQIAEITCTTGQYNPSTDTFTLYDSVDFEVTYTGGTGKFLTEASNSPFDNTLTMVDGLVMNRDVLVDYIGPDVNNNRTGGEEFLILTHQDFLEAANNLAEWKNEQGILTHVYIVNDGEENPAPDTAEEINDLIEEHYNECLVRPSYVLLLGDAEFIPTFYVEDYSNPDRPTIGSDYPYSNIYDQGDLIDFMFPDIGVGRISVDTLAEANIVVNKIIAYEKTPPEVASFYENAAVVSQFQCCRSGHTGWAERTFVEASEFTRDVLLNHGYTVERIYTETGSSTAPRRYFDGTHLPVDLGLYSDFPWDGDTQDIIDAFTDPEGRFLITHRDHGSPEKWVHPLFTIDDILNNLGEQNPALLPVVFSINCSSGLFDNETCGGCQYTNSDGIYFCEALLRKGDGGAVGVFGATRGSPSWPNTYLTKGMIDAIWPDAIPDFGGDTPQRRLGDILNYGKLYMFRQMGAYMDVVSELWPGHEDIAITGTLNEFSLFHCFGDPTLEIWTAPPGGLPQDVVMQDTADGVRVGYAVDGAIVTVYQKTADGVVALGRGTIESGQADISYIQDPDDSYPIEISVSKAGYVAGVLTPLMEASASSLAFGSEGTELNLTVTNTGGGTLEWNLADTPDWLIPSAVEGEIAAGESEIVSISVDRTGLADGDYEHDLVFDTNVLNVESETLAVSVTMTVETSIPTFPLLVTGLTESYDENGDLTTGLLDDGYYQQGNAFSYTDNGDGSVTDQVTGLRWMQNGSDTEVTFSGAQSYCSAVTIDGGGWRIPNVYEYYTILNFSQENPAMEHTWFPPSTKSYYWTATPMAGYTSSVWSIREPYAGDNIFDSVSDTNYVRCVKETALEPPATGRFTDNGSGTVLDTWTGLVWEAASDHNGTSGHTWEEALSYCEGKTTLGRSWHLPNVKQMQSLLSKDVAEPAIDTGFFTNDSYTLWTSSTDAYTNSGSMELAWAASEGGYGDFVMAGVFKASSTDVSSRPMGARCVSCSW